MLLKLGQAVQIAKIHKRTLNYPVYEHDIIFLFKMVTSFSLFTDEDSDQGEPSGSSSLASPSLVGTQQKWILLLRTSLSGYLMEDINVLML